MEFATADERIKFREKINIIIITIYRDNPSGTTFLCLSLVLTLVSNILDHPNNPAFLSVKTKNPRIQSNLILVPGGVDLILELGFRRRVIEFEEKYVFEAMNETGLALLVIGKDALETSLRKAEERKVVAERLAKEEKDEEANRKKDVLLKIEDDKQRRKMRQERSKSRRGE
ncbi:hypothetical protein BC937DRAFT_88861 [Endogone sp. FLAS-F59071]|nr:hypothetical protein BC937DRAFT_88861 [Endogone sp. FLAS-F59071]|eukprot:RUS18348.1 hypothetical protein BC937DRAFT_88861 [Endogone sp. FLAS-F59071]